MRKLLFVLLFLALTTSLFAQYHGRLSADDQRRFDSYYSRWQDYKRTNNRDEIISMEKRMQDVMAHYNIPASTPYAAIATNGERDPYDRYRGRLSHNDQRRFDSYYTRWLDYKRNRDWDEVRSMEGRMRDVMQGYDIPTSVPFEVLASNGSYDNDWDHGWHRWRGKLSADDQRRFDSYFSRWQDYRRASNWDEVRSMEGRMRDVMQQYDIPSDVPFEQIASSGQEGYWQGGSDYRGDLRILSATYGNGYRVANVTQRLQEMVRNGQLSVYVDNDSMGGDPAPGIRKTLSLSYSFCGGRPQNVTVREGVGLTIP